MAIQNSTYHKGCIYDPVLGEGEVVGGYRSYHWIGKNDGGFLYVLNVTIALSLTIRPLFANECLRRPNQQGEGGSLWIKILGCFL